MKNLLTIIFLFVSFTSVAQRSELYRTSIYILTPDSQTIVLGDADSVIAKSLSAMSVCVKVEDIKNNSVLIPANSFTIWFIFKRDGGDEGRLIPFSCFDERRLQEFNSHGYYMIVNNVMITDRDSNQVKVNSMSFWKD